MHNNSNYNKTVIGISRIEKYFWIIGFSIIGAALGYFLSSILAWINSVERFSNQKRISLITKIADYLNSTLGEWSTLLFLMIGLIIGIYLAKMLLRESPTVSVSKYNIEIANDLKSLTFIRDEIQDIYYDEEFVIVGASGHELLRESYDIKKETLGNALRNYEYPFRSNDPYETYFKLWSSNTQELSTPVNALMKARAVVKKSKDKDERIDIDEELSKLGVIVKDEDKKQYWRLVIPKL